MKNLKSFENFNADTTNEAVGGGKDKMKCKDVGVQKKTNQGSKKGSSSKLGSFVFYKADVKNPKFGGGGDKPSKYFKKTKDGYKETSLGEINKMKTKGKVSIKTMPPKEIKNALNK